MSSFGDRLLNFETASKSLPLLNALPVAQSWSLTVDVATHLTHGISRLSSLSP
jgi:hypothetical protein